MQCDFFFLFRSTNTHRSLKGNVDFKKVKRGSRRNWDAVSRWGRHSWMWKVLSEGLNRSEIFLVFSLSLRESLLESVSFEASESNQSKFAILRFPFCLFSRVPLKCIFCISKYHPKGDCKSKSFLRNRCQLPG